MSVMDLSGVVSSFLTGTAYNVTRTGAASFGTDGRAVAGSSSTFTVAGMVAPMSGRDLQNLPEGMRTKETRWMYSTAELRTQIQGSQEPDVVTIDGASWQVQSSEAWVGLGNFYRYLLMRVGN